MEKGDIIEATPIPNSILLNHQHVIQTAVDLGEWRWASINLCTNGETIQNATIQN